MENRNITNELGTLVKEIFTQCTETANGVVIAVYDKVWLESRELKKELLSFQSYPEETFPSQNSAGSKLKLFLIPGLSQKRNFILRNDLSLQNPLLMHQNNFMAMPSGSAK